MGKPTKLHILNHGNMHCDLGWLIAQGGLTFANRDNPFMPRQWVECPTYTVLIEHPDGLFLWDATVPRDWQTRWAISGGNEFFPYDDVREDQYFDSQLQRLGIGIEEIKHVAISHLHQDHAGNASAFKNTGAMLYVSKAEYDGAMGFEGPANGAHIKTDYEDLNWSPISGDVELLDGITLIQAPGHTWGTCALKVDLPNTGTMIFTSDAVYLKGSYGPPAVGPGVIYDSLSWFSSVEKIRKIAEQSNAQLVFGHDAGQINTLRLAPNAYYD